MKFIDLNAQYLQLKNEIDKAVLDVLSRGDYILGYAVNELEERLCEYIGVKHSITCGNGTDALQISLLALGISKGDAVFCPTYSFFATAEAIAQTGATPIFLDTRENSFNICSEDLERKILETEKEGKLKPSAVVAVDMFGLPANYPKITKITSKYGIPLIEDAAQGFGGKINGKLAGSFGDIATTSFFPAKPLGCYGDGGAIFTNDDHLAELARSLRSHGQGKNKYDNVRIGFNSRLDTIQAAILQIKLTHFESELKMRNELAKEYERKLRAHVVVPTLPPNYESSWAQYTIKTNLRDEVRQQLQNKKIPSMIYYEKCIHQQQAFSNNNKPIKKLQNSEQLAKQALSLPMSPYLTITEAYKVSQHIINALHKTKDLEV